MAIDALYLSYLKQAIDRRRAVQRKYRQMLK